jgi:hypothetical protein
MNRLAGPIVYYFTQITVLHSGNLVRCLQHVKLLKTKTIRGLYLKAEDDVFTIEAFLRVCVDSLLRFEVDLWS